MQIQWSGDYEFNRKGHEVGAMFTERFSCELGESTAVLAVLAVLAVKRKIQ